MARPIQDSVVLIGDSITSRQEVPDSLQARFAAVYRRDFDVLNRGYGGYTTRLLLPLLDEFLCRKEEAAGQSRIRLATVWLGTNDAVVSEAPTGQHVPLEEYAANLHKILDHLTSGERYPIVPNIILITPPPCYPGASTPPSTERDTKITKQYAEAARKVGEEWKAKSGRAWAVEVVDTWADMVENVGEGQPLTRYLTDGVHLTKAGYDVVWDGVVKAIKQGGLKDRGLDWEDQSLMPVPE
ncbi:SGNH hydrolase-type esterase domain-containing protein [Kockovaella imperatae]|uniref:SGNH hydrolase-type esterase domain-containing protein n=1 Tax=Kockovaella imperatae TaxID=4999 RepID=A0A1Y1UBM3_9TREE|nr:SGNH hydrolase-type esterase domain-containing protein [Kockovaella imperatae]ORX35419.1 SGNH hydrolase-type esterase domain-containing protein [Kockovaella imperatae]